MGMFVRTRLQDARPRVLYLDEPTMHALRDIARAEGVSISSVVRALVRQHLAARANHDHAHAHAETPVETIQETEV